jgi:two-component system chemotaxis sensor kinase CheA
LSRLSIERSIATLSGYADRNLPEHARHDGNLQRQGRTSFAFAAVFITQVPTYVVIFTLIDVYAAVVIMFAGSAGLLLTPRLMRRSLTLGTRSVILLLAFVLYGISFYTGGLQAPAMYWTAALPVMGMMTESVRAGLCWLVLVVAMVGLMVVAEQLGVAFPPMAEVWKVQFLGAMGIAILTIVLAGLAYSYEVTRKAMVGTLDATNRDMRLVLENVDQGFVTVVDGGHLAGARSVITDTWFGAPRPAETFGAWIGRTDSNTGAYLTMFIDQLFSGELPSDLCIMQLPTTFRVGELHYALRYRPVYRGELLTAMVVIISDTTEQVKAEHVEAVQRDVFALFGHLMSDPAGVRQFLTESEHQVAQLDQPRANSLRLIHTLKGNAGVFGMTRFARVCHDLESSAQDEDRRPTVEELGLVTAAWRATSAQVQPLVAEQASGLGIVEAELAQLDDAIRAGTSPARLLATTQALRGERGDLLLARLADQAAGLAARVDRCPVVTEVRHGGERFPAAAWAPIWSAMVHAVRNAVDHGTESSADRIAQGKPGSMRLLFESTLDATGLRVRMEDDGAGIDWERVRERARARGLRASNANALHEALFADGLSTCDAATELSGRGVGLGALRDACLQIQATITIRSVRGAGTTLEIVAPLHPAARDERAVPAAAQAHALPGTIEAAPL